MTFCRDQFFATFAWRGQITACRVLVCLVLMGGIGDANAGQSPSGIVLAKDGFTIVVSAGEDPAVQLAVEALRRDFLGVLGFKPTVQSTIPSPASAPVLVIMTRQTGAAPAPGVTLKPLDGFESHRVYADAGARRVYLEGADTRGTIYAIYTFSEHLLGVPPLHYWSSWRPVPREAVVVPGDCDLFFRSPSVRFRSILLGDTDFFSPWQKRDPGNDNIWLETVLRLKLNTVEGYSTIEPGYQMSAFARLIARYGLVLTSHHISGLNTSFATWDAYWTKVRKMEPPRLLLTNDAAIREFFRYNAETVQRSGMENLWTLAFRGARDQPFWSIFEDAPKDDPARAAVINRMLQIQLDTIKEVTGETSPHVRITLYDEMADLMAKGLLQPPATPNLILTYVAARRDPYPYDDLVRFDAAPPVKLGYYMNFGFASTGAHLAPAEGPWKMEFNYRYVATKGPLEFSVVNVGCLREFLLELSAHARLLWDFEGYNTDQFLRDYCAQYFGAAHAPAIAQLYRDYYQAFWEPKKPDFPGMERQFVFQDLRYARVFDQVARVFYASPGAPDLNPLRDIGYERLPGRTFRLDLQDLGAATQIDALMAGLQRTIPRFTAVGDRCTEIRAQLAPDRQVFFNDNLRVYSYTMASLSSALLEFLTAYRQQAEPAAVLEHLARAEHAVDAAQRYLHETEHGVFATWYRDAEPMARTMQLDAWKSTMTALRKAALGRQEAVGPSAAQTPPRP
jgi:hypothetical protein